MSLRHKNLLLFSVLLIIIDILLKYVIPIKWLNIKMIELIIVLIEGLIFLYFILSFSFALIIFLKEKKSNKQ